MKNSISHYLLTSPIKHCIALQHCNVIKQIVLIVFKIFRSRLDTVESCMTNDKVLKGVKKSHASALSTDNVVWAMDASNGRWRFSRTCQLKTLDRLRSYFAQLITPMTSSDGTKFMVTAPGISSPQSGEVAPFVLFYFLFFFIFFTHTGRTGRLGFVGGSQGIFP